MTSVNLMLKCLIFCNQGPLTVSLMSFVIDIVFLNVWDNPQLCLDWIIFTPSIDPCDLQE